MKHMVTLHSCLDKGVAASSQDPFHHEYFTLHQADRRTLQSGNHSLISGSCFELGTISSAIGEVWLDGHGRLHSQEIVLLPPNSEIHMHVRGEAADYVFIKLSVHDDEAERLFPQLHRITQAFVIPQPVNGGAGGEVLVRLLQETASEHMYSHLLISSYMNQLLVTVSRHLIQSKDADDIEEGPIRKVQTRRDLARQALMYIDHQYMQIKDLREIAQMMGYSYSYVSHIFREEVGISLQAYYTNKKIKRAMHMLAKNRHSVTRVAEMLQYQSIHSFSKAFKRFTGLTPTEYQQLYELKQITM